MGEGEVKLIVVDGSGIYIYLQQVLHYNKVNTRLLSLKDSFWKEAYEDKMARTFLISYNL
jgi:hypothetical protein